jgi:enoyl-CoA hydratase/carnithine racemase
MSRLIRLDVANGVARITLDRPDKLNAFGDDMREQLVEALDRVALTPDARVLVITGAGRAFCAGGDVHHMVALKERGAGFDGLAPLLELGRGIITRVHALPIPTLAAVNGVAAGAGLNLALACDLRIASAQATFGETFVRIGLHPDWGGTYFLPRNVGLSKALELCWTGEMIDAAHAYLIGLVDRVFAPERFEADVIQFAERLAQAPQTSVQLAKQTLRAAMSRPLAACLDAEAEAQRQCWDSPDSAEGLKAFVEKRTPSFDAAPRAVASAAAWRFE